MTKPKNVMVVTGKSTLVAEVAAILGLDIAHPGGDQTVFTRTSYSETRGYEIEFIAYDEIYESGFGEVTKEMWDDITKQHDQEQIIEEIVLKDEIVPMIPSPFTFKEPTHPTSPRKTKASKRGR